MPLPHFGQPTYSAPTTNNRDMPDLRSKKKMPKPLDKTKILGKYYIVPTGRDQAMVMTISEYDDWVQECERKKVEKLGKIHVTVEQLTKEIMELSNTHNDRFERFISSNEEIKNFIRKRLVELGMRDVNLVLPDEETRPSFKKKGESKEIVDPNALWGFDDGNGDDPDMDDEGEEISEEDLSNGPEITDISEDMDDFFTEV